MIEWLNNNFDKQPSEFYTLNILEAFALCRILTQWISEHLCSSSIVSRFSNKRKTKNYKKNTHTHKVGNKCMRTSDRWFREARINFWSAVISLLIKTFMDKFHKNSEREKTYVVCWSKRVNICSFAHQIYRSIQMKFK